MYGADALLLTLDQSVFSIRMRNTVRMVDDGRVVVVIVLLVVVVVGGNRVVVVVVVIVVVVAGRVVVVAVVVEVASVTVVVVGIGVVVLVVVRMGGQWHSASQIAPSSHTLPGGSHCSPRAGVTTPSSQRAAQSLPLASQHV